MENLAVLDNLSTEELEQYLSKRRFDKILEDKAKRDDYEKLRNDLGRTLCEKVLEKQRELIELKSSILNDLDAFYELLQEYSSRHKDGQGNFQIITNDQKYKIEYRNSKIMRFDERALTAKQHIMEFVAKRFSGDEEVKEFILGLLDKEETEQFNVADVFKLLSMESKFNDPSWNKGIALLKESYQAIDTKSYVRFYQKNNQGKYQPIILNFAALDVE